MLKYAFLALFVILIVSISIYSKKKVNNVQDFFLGGRKMGPWISAFAYGTTYFSAVIFIGYAGSTGWNFGLSGTWVGIGNAVIGSLLAWLVLAKRTRRMTHELNVATMPEFFEKRYDSMAMKIVTALIIFVFLVPYSASVYKGLSYLFENVFKINYEYCMFTMALLTGIYLLLGGYIATALTDFVQGIIMLTGVIVLIFFIVGSPEVGGLTKGISQLREINPDLVAPFSGNPMNLLSLVVLTSLGTWGLPQMVHKFYAIKDEDAIKKGTVVSTLFAAIIAGGAYFIGSFGRLFVSAEEITVGNTLNFDMIIPKVLEIAVPDALMGLIIILVLSASMSTLSSLVLVSSSAISLDLAKGVLFPNMKKETSMMLMRFMCIIFVALSYMVAMLPNNPILTLMSFSWGTIAGAFLAPFVYGLYWKKTTRAGAWAGFISGITCSIGGVLMYGINNTKMAPVIGAVAMIVSLIAVPVISIVTSKLPEKYVERAFGDNIANVGITNE